MTRRLRNLHITRNALVDAGANYDFETGEGAHILLYKAKMQTCPECGSKVVAGGKKCPQCGYSMTAKADETPAALTWDEVQAASASVGGKQHSAGDFAYVPDKDKPSTWALPVFDARHAAAAAAAIGPKGYRGKKAKIPSSAMAGVKAKVRAAYRKFFPDTKEADWPDGIRKGQDEGDGGTLLDKVGRKISGARLQRLKDAHEALGHVIDEAETAEGQEGGSNMGDKVKKEDLPADLPDTVQAYLAQVEAERDEAVTKAEAAKPAGTEPTEDEVLKQLPEGLRKRFTDAEARSKSAEETAARLSIEKREGDNLVRLAKLDKVPSLDAKKMGVIVREMEDAGLKDQAAEVERVLTAVHEAVKTGKLFAELGNGGTGGEDGALAKLRAHAAELREKDPSLTAAKAMVMAKQQHPDLAKQYQEEAGIPSGAK